MAFWLRREARDTRKQVISDKIPCLTKLGQAPLDLDLGVCPLACISQLQQESCEVSLMETLCSQYLTPPLTWYLITLAYLRQESC